MNTAQGAEGAAIQFARNQILANWLHDQGLGTTTEEGEGGELEGGEGPGPSRTLNFNVE